MRHSSEERFEFMEFRIYWHGRFNRSDLIDRFGVSPTQASMDFKHYQNIAPGNLLYDGTEKTYRPSGTFSPAFYRISAESYLTPLLSVGTGAVEPTSLWLRTIPAVHVSPVPARGVSAPILQAIVRALEGAVPVEILYQSMSTPEPSWRWIEPHAFAHDGFRWHARSFCQRSGAFKDFVLSRILDCRFPYEPSPVLSVPSDDLDWQTEVTFQIRPHPALSEAQQRVIRLDYGMDTTGQADINVRKSMLYYTLKRLGLDTDPAVRRPQDQQIILANASEVFAQLGRNR